MKELATLASCLASNAGKRVRRNFMKKKDLAALALAGLLSIGLTSCQPQKDKGNGQKNGRNGTNGNGQQQEQPSSNGQGMSATEQAFSSKLSSRTRTMFDRMNMRERQMSMDAAAAGCKGKNACKGLGGCKTKDHACKGQNSCKGTGGGKVSPNEAVELVYQKMEAKRSEMQNQ